MDISVRCPEWHVGIDFVFMQGIPFQMYQKIFGVELSTMKRTGACPHNLVHPNNKSNQRERTESGILLSDSL
jgi:hypothetical protein